MPPPLSVIIDNYNYGRFIGQSIESALNQTVPGVEVIVVDDGSTDNSRDVITSFGNRITPVLKSNGGQGSAFNAGFAVSHGEVCIFLDSDDVLMPDTVAKVLKRFEEPGVVKAHWPLKIIDENGRETGAMKESALPDGDLRKRVLRDGPAAALPSAPTSGNAYRREFLDEFMPIPEFEFRMCADSYLFTLAPATGIVRAFKEPLGYFRRHGKNNYQYKTFPEKLELGVVGYEQQAKALARFCHECGLPVDLEHWKDQSWWPRIARVAEDLFSVVPAGKTVIFADEDQLEMGRELEGRKLIPFLEKNGIFWGTPADSDAAIVEIERMKGSADYFAFAWTAMWWLEHYREFSAYLFSRFPVLIQNPRLVVFDLSGGATP